MLLDELANLRKQLSETIDLHEATLRKSEAATRYALIDPVLNLLGWDLKDLSRCIPEFKNMDYALFAASKEKTPIIVIEAKSLDTKMSEKVQTQLVTYCVTQGVNYGILTDGRKWIIYDVFQAKALEEKIIVEFDICDRIDNVVLKCLWLWHGNFEENTAPLVPIQPQVSSKEIPKSSEKSDKRTNLNSLLKNPERLALPSTIVLPDGSTDRAKNFIQLSTIVLVWVESRGDLKHESIPLNEKGCFINNRPFNASGKPFQHPIEVNGLYFEGNRNKKSHVRFMHNLLKYCGYSTERILVS